MENTQHYQPPSLHEELDRLIEQLGNGQVNNNMSSYPINDTPPNVNVGARVTFDEARNQNIPYSDPPSVDTFVDNIYDQNNQGYLESYPNENPNQQVDNGFLSGKGKKIIIGSIIVILLIAGGLFIFYHFKKKKKKKESEAEELKRKVNIPNVPQNNLFSPQHKPLPRRRKKNEKNENVSIDIDIQEDIEQEGDVKDHNMETNNTYPQNLNMNGNVNISDNHHINHPHRIPFPINPQPYNHYPFHPSNYPNHYQYPPNPHHPHPYPYMNMPYPNNVNDMGSVNHFQPYGQYPHYYQNPLEHHWGSVNKNNNDNPMIHSSYDRNPQEMYSPSLIQNNHPPYNFPPESPIHSSRHLNQSIRPPTSSKVDKKAPRTKRKKKKKNSISNEDIKKVIQIIHEDCENIKDQFKKRLDRIKSQIKKK